MNRWISLLALGATVSCLAADPVLLTVAERNGTLTWTNSMTNAVYAVQWSNRATGAWRNFESLRALDAIRSSNAVVTAEVPVFYRVGAFDEVPVNAEGTYQYEGYNADGSLIVVGWLSLLPIPGVNGFRGEWALGWVGSWSGRDPVTLIGRQIGQGSLVATWQPATSTVTMNLTPNIGNEAVAVIWDQQPDGVSRGIWSWVYFANILTNGTCVLRKACK